MSNRIHHNNIPARLTKSNPLFRYISSALSLVDQDLHKDDPAHVRLGHTLCKEEESFLSARTRKAHKAITSLIDQDIQYKHTPKIALCTSGGGLRAMFATAGLLSGLEKMNFLDTVSYTSCLSGSSFAISSWLAHECSAEELKSFLTKEFGGRFTRNFEIVEILKTGVGRLLYGQKISPVNVFGSMIANRIYSDFHNDAYHLGLSQSADKLKNGAFPLPLYTAINVPTQDSPSYTWIEMNPFEIRFQHKLFDAHIPSWSFGRSFKHGHSQDMAPEHSLAFIMGICGSAFSVSLEEAYGMYKKSIPSFLKMSAGSLLVDTDLGKLRLKPGVVYNPLYKHPLARNFIGSKEKNLYLMDAGIDFNIPLPPLLDTARNLDCIIVLDASTSLKGAPELKRAEQYARDHHHRFPAIDYTHIDEKLVSVFGEYDKSVPTVVYIPLKHNPLFSPFKPEDHLGFRNHLNTFNLRYTEKQSREVCDLVEFTTIEHEHILSRVIKSCIRKKKS
jgi:phospholipase A2